MATFRRFEEIEAWQIARQLTKAIYAVSKQGAFAKDFGLRGQICRAAVSVMSNIAEGFERGGNKEFVQFLSVAKSSAGEVRSQLYVALDVAYIDQRQFDELTGMATQTAQKIGALMNYLRQSEFKGNKRRPLNPEL